MAIVNGDYSIGDKLAPNDQVTAVDASASAAHEAIMVLNALGMVSSRTQAEAVVNDGGRWNSLDPRIIAWRMRSRHGADQIRWLAQLRSAIEPMAAALAARNATPDECAHLSGLAGEMITSWQVDLNPGLVAANAAFHRAILEASGNPMFASLGRSLESALLVRLPEGLLPRHVNQRTLRLHDDVAAAIADRDAAGAEMILRMVVGQSEAVALAALAAQAEDN
jgi:DNA-binding FadR family transcriptional regulator